MQFKLTVLSIASLYICGVFPSDISNSDESEDPDGSETHFSYEGAPRFRNSLFEPNLWYLVNEEDSRVWRTTSVFDLEDFTDEEDPRLWRTTSVFDLGDLTDEEYPRLWRTTSVFDLEDFTDEKDPREWSIPSVFGFQDSLSEQEHKLCPYSRYGGDMHLRKTFLRVWSSLSDLYDWTQDLNRIQKWSSSSSMGRIIYLQKRRQHDRLSRSTRSLTNPISNWKKLALDSNPSVKPQGNTGRGSASLNRRNDTNCRTPACTGGNPSYLDRYLELNDVNRSSASLDSWTPVSYALVFFSHLVFSLLYL